MDDAVVTLAVSGNGELYVGGEFITADGVKVNHIAKWNGEAWSALAEGVDGDVGSLAVSRTGDVYVGGRFANAGGVRVNHIAKWDGSSWSDLGGGTNGSVMAVALGASGDVYAGGKFTEAGLGSSWPRQRGAFANNVARWDGKSWSALGSGITVGRSFGVLTLMVSEKGEVYAGGTFSTAGGALTHNIAKWDGKSWSGLCGDSIRSTGWGMCEVSALALNAHGGLYVGGSFSTVGDAVAWCVAEWDGTSWSGLGGGNGLQGWSRPPKRSGYTGSVDAIAVTASGEVYAGGDFETAGKAIAHSIARWDGSSWSPLGSGMIPGFSGFVKAVAVDGQGGVYAGGESCSVRSCCSWTYDRRARCLVRWNGASWSELGGGLDHEYGACTDVSALAVLGKDIYAGGRFSDAGHVPVKNIAKWNGRSWSALGPGLDIAEPRRGSVVTSLAVSGKYLYAGGSFVNSGGTSVSHVARWDGSCWSPLGTGLDGDVLVLLASGCDLYAGGTFHTAGGVNADGIAKWNGYSWSPVGSGGQTRDGWFGEVRAIAVRSRNVYVGGKFTTFGGVKANNIAKWNGMSWAPLESGTDEPVNALAFNGDTLMVGGEFSFAGGKPSAHFADW